jgi:putative ABC transport system permease protein
MSDLLRDLRYGIRTLLRSPGFLVTAVLALALGVGSTTAIFSLVRGVVLDPLPYAAPDRLVSIWDVNRERGLDHEPLSPVNFMDYRALGQAFSEGAAWWRPEITLHDEAQEPIRVDTIEVSGNFTSVLGVRPVLGAGFPDGVLHSRERIALISHRLWQSRFHGDSGIVGRRIKLNDDQYEVAGVMPRGFQFPGNTDIWQRLVWDLMQHSRGAHFMEGVARLRDGASVAQAQREVDALTSRLGSEFTGTNRGWQARIIPLHDEVVGYFKPALLALLAAVGLLLLIACINVASLLLARAASRSREVAVRAAIGASRQRLVRQFLSESLLLAALGGLAGVALAFAFMRGIVAVTPFDIPRIGEVGVDARVLAFALLLTLCTAVAFGLLPALFTSRADLQQILKEGGRSQAGSAGGRRAHGVLVAAEIALAVTLLSGAGLLYRSVARLAAEDPGFRPDGIVTAGVQLNGAAYSRWPQVEQFHSTLVQSLRQQHGITAAGASNFLPLASGWRIPFLVRGLPAPPRGDEPTAQYHSVSEGYFETLGVQLRRGRLFDTHDTAQTRGVVVINEALARRYFAGDEPVGETILCLTTNIGPLGATMIQNREHEIIGVVSDVKNSSLQSAAEPALFYTTRQFPFRHIYLVARGDDPARVSAAIRDTVRRADASMPSPEMVGMEEIVGESVKRPRFFMFSMSIFAAAALSLAALGIFGLLSYTVTERQQELSIRMALGARRGGVLWMVLRHGLTLAAIGSVAGVLAAFIAIKRIGSLVPEVSQPDPATLAAVSAVALTIALFACALPAWRASRIDPLEGLKE